jgi:predicted PurR-regulated permease PerM
MATRPLKSPAPEGGAGAGREPRGESGFAARVLIVAAVAAAALAVWKASDVLLMAFGGLLLAIGLRALADLLARYTLLRSPLTLPAAVASILLAVGVLVWGIGDALASQFDQLVRQLPVAVTALRDWLAKTGLGRVALGSLGSIDAAAVAKLIGAALTTLGAVANVLLLLVLGIYLAADPGLYHRGVLRLLPARLRPEASAALSSAAVALRNWLGGQLVAMVVVGAVTGVGLVLLDVPLALSLATIAALLEFIPFFGPILAAIPAILIAFGHDPVTALYVALLYLGIQHLEGYVLMPLVQRWAVALPPALGALSVVVFGVLFGLPGVLFGVPLAIVGLVFVRELVLEREHSR